MNVAAAEEKVVKYNDDVPLDRKPKWFKQWYKVLTHILSEEKQYICVRDDVKPMRICPGPIRNRLILLHNIMIDSIRKLYPRLDQEEKPQSVFGQLKFLESLPLCEELLGNESIWEPGVAPTSLSRLKVSTEPLGFDVIAALNADQRDRIGGGIAVDSEEIEGKNT